MNDSIFILAVLALNVVIAELLVRRTLLRHIGTALLVIVVTAIAANVGIIPTYSPAIPVYGAVFGSVAPFAIFCLLLQVEVRRVLRAGPAMISLFLIGSLGTVLGVLVGMAAVDGPTRLGDLHAPLGGMFVGTYTGGSINFNAVALHYGVVEKGVVYAAANAVDSLMTTVWMALTIAIPRILRRFASSRRGPCEPAAVDLVDDVDEDTERIHPLDLGLVLALGAGAVWASELAAARVRAAWDVDVPPILVLTTIALLLAQLPVVARLQGARTLGLFGVYLFLAVIGALCDVGALRQSGGVGLTLLAFVTIAVSIHGLVVFGAALLLRLDPDAAAVASQANVGGGTTALALARSLGRPDLVLPALLVGALGNAIGTYLGFWTVQLLR